MSTRKHPIALPLIACVALLAAVGCWTASRNQARSPVQQLSNYQFDSTSPLAARIVPAPGFVIDCLNNYDKVDYYQDYIPTDQELSSARQYLLALPKRYQSILQSHLLGIYFIKDFVGSGFTEFVFDQANNPYAFIAVNSATLSTTISDWLTLRDQSCFKADGSDTRLLSDCGSTYTGFMYAILHESSHVVDFVLHYQPNPSVKSEKSFPFISQCWQGFSQPLP